MVKILSTLIIDSIEYVHNLLHAREEVFFVLIILTTAVIWAVLHSSSSFCCCFWGCWGLYVMFWQMYLENLEELLQLHHQRPISLDQVVAEVILAGIDALARDLRKRKRKKT